MKLLVRRAGFLTTVQDLGRPGYRAIGVSPGGALDEHALRVANSLVGNEESFAGLELTLGTIRLGFEDDRLIACCGGSFDVQIRNEQIPAGRTVLVQGDDELTVTAPPKGARGWLAISGGIDLPLVLGSRSTDLRSAFGGLEGRALRDGDVLELNDEPENAVRLRAALKANRVSPWSASQEWARTSPTHPFLRIVRGANWTLFDEDSCAELLRQPFTVLPDSDRMGARLSGPKLKRIEEGDLLSEAVAPGTIQVPPSGDPVLLLGDCQTVGGYPKIAHVITVDLASAAQLLPGDTVRFAEVSQEEAQRLLLERERDLQFFKAGLSLRSA